MCIRDSIWVLWQLYNNFFGATLWYVATFWFSPLVGSSCPVMELFAVGKRSMFPLELFVRQFRKVVLVRPSGAFHSPQAYPDLTVRLALLSGLAERLR